MKIFFARGFAFALVLAVTATGLWTGGGTEEAPTAAADKRYVTDPTTGKVVVAPEYGGTIAINGFAIATDWPPDPYFNWGVITVSGVVEKLGIGNWGIDRDVFDFKAHFLPEEFIIGALAESWELSRTGSSIPSTSARAFAGIIRHR